MRHIFLTICFILLSNFLNAQVQVLAEDDRFEKRNNDIDIKIVNNTILVPVDLGNNLKLYFILDTGVKTAIITEPLLIDLLQLPLERTINVKGYGTDDPIPAWVSTKFNYRLNQNHAFKNQDVIILKKSINLDQFLGEPVYGIIGYDFLRNHEVTINYNRSKMFIKNPRNLKRIERLKRKKNVKVYDLDFRGSKPFITTEIQDGDLTDSVKLLLDTGFSGAMSLYPNEKTDAFLFAPYIDNYQGYGMNGLIICKFKKIETFKINDKTKLKNVSSQFMDSLSLKNVAHVEYSDGSIGNDILKRFIVSIDYRNQKLYLKPQKKRIEEPFYFNRAGIRVLYIPSERIGRKKYKIHSVRKDSNAEKSGFQVDDYILSIDGRNTDRMGISDIYEMLNTATDLPRKIIVNRNNQEIEINFELETFDEWN